MGNNNTSKKFNNNIKFLNSPYKLGKKSYEYPTDKQLLDLENVQQKGNFDNIKSKYILKQIFDNLNKNRFLKIMNYNKKIQNRLDININNYKKFSETYTTIEIEIIPIKNLIEKSNSFIKNLDNIHVYFNDNKKEEIKKYDITANDKVKKIKVLIDYQIKLLRGLFEYCKCIESISFIKFYRNNITDMSYMFNGCTALKEINFFNFNTDNVTNMEGMFESCDSLDKLDLSKFNTEKVITMSAMFCCCTSLKEIKINNFNTKNVNNMNSMFHYCKSIKNLDLSNFDTNKVRDMEYMFDGCQKGLIKKIRKKYKNYKEQAFETLFNIDDFEGISL